MLNDGADRAVPADPEGEAPLEDSRVLLEDDEIEVRGTRRVQATLKALRCIALGFAAKGSKKQCLELLKKHIFAHTLFAGHEAQAQAIAIEDSACNPRSVSAPKTPSLQESEEHDHAACRNWCEFCVAHEGRQDQRRDGDHHGSTCHFHRLRVLQTCGDGCRPCHSPSGS